MRVSGGKRKGDGGELGKGEREETLPNGSKEEGGRKGGRMGEESMEGKEEEREPANRTYDPIPYYASVS